MSNASASRVNGICQRRVRLRVLRDLPRNVSALEYFTVATGPRRPRKSASSGNNASSQRKVG